MNTQRICFAVTFIITVAISAQTPEEAVHFLENESGIGVKAQAMGNSYVGLANDYSAIYWNPAGLTQLKTSEFTGSFYHMIFNNEANFAGNTLLENQSYTKFIDAEKSLDRRYMSGGFGYDIDRNTSLHFSYTRGLWERDSIDSYTPGGTHESIQTHRILAGITYRF